MPAIILESGLKFNLSRDVIQSARIQQRKTEVTKYKSFREVFTVKLTFKSLP